MFNLSCLWWFWRDFKTVPCSAPHHPPSYVPMSFFSQVKHSSRLFLTHHIGSPVCPHFYDNSGSLAKHNSPGAGWPCGKNSWPPHSSRIPIYVTWHSFHFLAVVSHQVPILSIDQNTKGLHVWYCSLGSPLPNILVLGPTCLAYIYLSQTSPIHMELASFHSSEDSRATGDRREEKMTSIVDMCVSFKLCTICLYYLVTINKPANKCIGYISSASIHPILPACPDPFGNLWCLHSKPSIRQCVKR